MDSKSVFAGALSFIGLADIFQTLGGNNSNGRLQIKNQYAPNPGVIYFEDGNPINAHSIDSLRNSHSKFFFHGSHLLSA